MRCPKCYWAARCRTVLIELGFISNKEDAYWLDSPAYQLALIEGIYAGIKNYLDQKQMVL